MEDGKNFPRRWFPSVLFCSCWNNNKSFLPDERENFGMGPLTLSEYVNTLEPYDPQKHGWRGEEPWQCKLDCCYAHYASCARAQPAFMMDLKMLCQNHRHDYHQVESPV